jgi:hypothetical protein
MRGDPRQARPEHGPISTAPKARPEAPQPEPVSTSRHAKPKILMGEVAAPKGQLIAAERDAFRAFMLARRLAPSTWAAAAGVPPGEILAFLTGRARSISPAIAAKLAAAAKVSVEEMFR